MSLALGLQVLVLLVALAGSFFFSSSETALFSLSARHFPGPGQEEPGMDRVRWLLSRPQHLLVLLLLGNNAVNIVAAELTNRLVQEGAGWWQLPPLWTTALSIVVGTLLLLVVGEITPKTLALHMPARMAVAESPVLSALERTLGPVVDALFSVTNRVLGLLGIERNIRAHVTEEELKTLVSVGEEEGVLEEAEREMIGRVLELEETFVREVFVPRPDVVRVGTTATVRDVLAASVQYGHSRIPVVGETIDDVRGICHVKDLIPYVRESKVDQPVLPLVRPVTYVPDTKRVDDCLREFLRKDTHMAVVIDEYGGTAGIVTLEDLVETIVGDIFDEYDEYEAPIMQVDEHRWRVDAGVSLADLEEEWGDDVLPKTEYDTLGGLVLDLFGRFPNPGEAIEHDRVTYTVEAVTRNRLRRVLVSFPEDGTVAPHGNGHDRSEQRNGASRNGNNR